MTSSTFLGSMNSYLTSIKQKVFSSPVTLLKAYVRHDVGRGLRHLHVRRGPRADSLLGSAPLRAHPHSLPCLPEVPNFLWLSSHRSVVSKWPSRSFSTRSTG